VLDNAATKEKARRAVQPIVRVLARMGLTPNMLTVTGFLLNAGVGLVIALGQPQLAGVLLILTSGFDLLDGALAKATGKGSKFGAFLDSTLDRYSEAIVLLGLLWLSVQRTQTLDIYLVYIVVVGSLLVSYTRARAEGLGLECRVGLLGRPERIAVLCVGLIFNWVTVALVILAVFSHVTALQRIVHVQASTRGK
jgi:CDP-diacylglycerol---glycerol-3-phosphate 3-phosphatidyltransferase